TSLFNVLLRFWPYQQGIVSIGSVPTDRLCAETVRDYCAVVSQHTFLFNTSIRENLLLACPGADDERLWSVLSKVGMAAEIKAMRRGLDTIVGEIGTRLSGGHSRRVAIARALLKDAPILLL